MNDNDIIKALECCEKMNCYSCPYYKEDCRNLIGGCVEKLEHDAINLINRQKAEIERLKDMVAQNEGVLPKYENLIKAEAIKEFTEKIKGIDLYQCVEEYYKNAELCYDVRQDWFCEYIDSLVKEMTEEQK